MTLLVQRIHRWLGDRLATRAARIVATILVLAALAWVGLPLLGTSLDLQAQRAGILRSLEKCSAKDGDPAALELLQRSTVTVGDRTYGGPRMISRAVDLFDDDGSLPVDVRNELSWRLLGDQVPLWMPYVLVRSPGLVIGLLCAAGAAALTAVWVSLLLPVLEVGGAVSAVAAFLWWIGWPVGAQWVLSAALSLLLFAFLWRAASALLSLRSGSFAVAANTVLEGIRTLAVPGFALPVALLLPFLALSRGREDALYQAIPGFLDWGHTCVYVFAALFVIFFGCASTSFEIRDRQVWSVVTKPISHGGWLLGKWIGTVTLGMVVVIGGTLLLAVGTSYLASQKPLDERDARDLRNTVLVGRVGTLPQYEELASDRLREIVDAAIEGDAVLKADIANGTVDEAQSRRTLAASKMREFLEQQRRIGPGESREFTFSGLAQAAALGREISLRYKLHGGMEDEHQKFPAMIQYASGKGAGMWELREWTPGELYSLDIEPKFIDPDGTLRLRIFSAGWDEEKKQAAPSSISIFMQDDSLEVMVSDSTFAGNLVSAMVVDGCKVAFLSAIAVVAGSLLSFPIAVLLAFGVFCMATITPFLSSSLRYYSPDQKSGILVWAFQYAVLAVASTIEFLLRGFAARSPSDSLAQGRSITWSVLGETVLTIGFAWTGGLLLVGWLGIRRKEIAVYSGQG